MNTTTPTRHLPAAASMRWPALLLLALLAGACAGNTGEDGSDTTSDVTPDAADSGDSAQPSDTVDTADTAACKDGEACEDGDPCTVGEACKDGACTGGGPKDCDDGSPCTTDTCSKEAGGCSHAPLDDAASCDDGDPCSTGDRCVKGACLPTSVTTCDDDNACTTDTCNTSGGCAHTADESNDGKAGSCEDGDACTNGDTCKQGVCLPGGVTDCDDGNACTDDACDSKQGCSHAATTEKDKLCDDGKSCTLGDHCIGALCVPDAVTSCTDDNPCTEDGCDDKGCTHTALAGTTPCDDGDACTKDDACKDGACVGAGKTCDDDNDCTKDTCDPKTSACSYETLAAKPGEKLPCDDGDPCTAPDHCEGALCLAGPVTACDDNNVCTTDSCSKDKGCTHTANTLPCDDGSLCTFLETCKDGVCTAGKAKVCIDGQPCTADGCDGKTGSCTFTKLTSTAEKPVPCDDGNACTKDEACGDGVCKGGQPGGCDDGNACTYDICDASKGCLNVETAAPCDDGDACTTGDQCQGGACKTSGTVNCDDGKSCTDDSCNKANGKCLQVDKADGAGCDDGDPCSTGEACAGGACKAPVAKAEAVVRTNSASFPDLPEVALGDLDGDGTLDLLAAYVDGARRDLPDLGAMNGKGDGSFAALKALGSWKSATSCVDNAAPKPVLLLADVDGDKDLDVLVGGVTHHTCGVGSDERAKAGWYFENKAGVLQTPAALHDFGLLGGTTKYVHTLGMAWGRFNGGNSYQLAVHYATLATTPGAKVVHAIKVLTPATALGKTLWTNWATSPTTALPDLDGYGPNRSRLRVADLDGDGRDDLIPVFLNANTSAGGLVLQASASTAGTFEPSKMTATGGAIGKAVALPADFDGDGDVDLAVQVLDDGNGGDSFQQPVLLFANDGSATWWKKPGLTGTTLVEKAAGGAINQQLIDQAFDLDGDGRADLAGIVSDGNNMSPAFWVTAPGKISAYFGTTVIAQELAIAGVGQLDGTGPEEIVLALEKQVLVVTTSRDGCQDGNPCTLDTCDKTKGCTATQVAAACEDGDACTINDTCSAGKCQPGLVKSCNDDNACTDDSCDSAKGCQYANNTASCDSGGCPGSCNGGSCTAAQPQAEVCDDKDNDCDGTTDNGCADADGDGFCKAGPSVVGQPKVCPNGGDDCNDGDKDISPGQPEVCGDDKDNDCNGIAEETCTCGDGIVTVKYGEQCDDGNTTNGDGCSDSCQTEAPKCGDGTCNGTEKCNTCAQDCGACKDGDGDGVASDQDCDDNDDKKFPGNTEVCDGKDNNCDGTADNGVSCDDGVACTDDSCAGATGCKHTANDAACDDGNACTDDSCASATGCKNAANTATCDDGDGCTKDDACAAGVCKAGTGCAASASCTAGKCTCPSGQTGDGFTCACPSGEFNYGSGCLPKTTTKGTQFTMNPFCGAKQNITVGKWDVTIKKEAKVGGGFIVTLEGGITVTSGGYGHNRMQLPVGFDPPDGQEFTCTGTPAGGSGATTFKVSGVDWTTFTEALFWVPDKYSGSYTVKCVWTTSAASPVETWAGLGCVKQIQIVEPVDGDSDGYPAGQDCDDTNGAINPDADEVCDGVDNDCDGNIDNSAKDAKTYYKDNDKDGWGFINDVTKACEAPDGYSNQGGDCDDAKAGVYPGATETCNGQDDDCDGNVDNGVSCDDGNECTDDACSGACTNVANTASCDDKDICTLNDACKDGTCSGTAKDCDDGNACTLDSCSGGVCGHVNAADGSDCGSGSICQGGKCVPPPVCGDGKVEGSEPCDDGNTSDTDGCSSSCEIETGYYCTGGPSTCFKPCDPNPCKNSGTCAISGGYEPCTCVGSFSGLTCENAKPTGWQPGPSLTLGNRTQAEVVKLKSGKILVIGGLSGGAQSKTAEVYDPAGSGTMTGVSNDMGISRRRTASVLLQDGRVLVTHGDTQGNNVLTNVLIYDPQTNSFDGGTDTGVKRLYHTATLLSDGRVLIAGGSLNIGQSAQNSATVFSPSNKTYVTVVLGGARQDHAALLLGNGKVLLTGGRSNATTWHSGSVVFDPSTNTFTDVVGATGARNLPFVFPLPNGKVLIGGGGIEDTFAIYDPVTNTATKHNGGDGIRNSWEATATQLKDGRVLVAGGKIGGVQTNTTRIYNPQSNTFTDGPNLTVAVRNHGAVRILDGRVLIVAGNLADNSPVNGTQIFDPATNTIVNGNALAQTRYQFVPIALDNGGAFLAGGYNGSYLNSTAVFK